MRALALELSWICFALFLALFPLTFWNRRDDAERERFERERRNYGRNA